MGVAPFNLSGCQGETYVWETALSSGRSILNQIEALNSDPGEIFYLACLGGINGAGASIQMIKIGEFPGGSGT